MKVSDYIINYLRDYTDHIFLLPGGNSMHLVDSVGKSGIPYTVCLHEQACAFAAIGYAEYSGKLGVCITTSGPGALNALTGCAAAYVEGVPVLFISGQTPTNFLMGDFAKIAGCSQLRLFGVQGIELIPQICWITKDVDRLMDFNFKEIKHILNRLINIAFDYKKSSVWLEVPLNIQAMEI